jgi:predicted ester cyclase
VSLGDNKEVVRSFYAEAINGRDTYACERWLSEGFVHNGVKRGREGQREVIAYFLAAFEPLEHEILLLLAEDNLVAAHQRWKGRQVGEFLGQPAGGLEIAFTSTAVLKIAGGEIAQAWDEMDSGAIVAQMSAPAQA